jgi:RNA polymerase sigma factor (TIGR02999 family)
MNAPREGDVTRLLIEWRDGSEDALNELMPLVYSELHRIAGRHLRNERASATLQTTVLIHEAYMRLVGADVEWDGRKHFLAIASNTMRRILVDHARARSRVKRGGPHAVPVTLTNAIAADGGDQIDIIAVDQALEKLAGFDERKAKIVELHFFGGLTYDEIAEVMDLSPATVHRDLRTARSWLYNELNPG